MQLDTNIILQAVPAFILLIIVEAVYLIREHRFPNTKKDMLASAGLSLGYFILGPITKASNLIVYALLYQYRICALPNNMWLAWILCFLAYDFTHYWSHRLSHEVRFLWASHSVHHSAEVFTLSTAFRLSWTSNLSGLFLFWAWMPLVGVTPAMLLFMKALTGIYAFWLHTEAIKKLPKWIEAVFNTPSHHRVHHASDVEYLDKNHGGALIVWDKIFGTFCEEGHAPKYGLTTNVPSQNPFVITFFEWNNLFRDLKKARNLREGLNYIFRAPGWSKDGSTKTTRQLQAAGAKEIKSTVHSNCENCSSATCKFAGKSGGFVKGFAE